MRVEFVCARGEVHRVRDLEDRAKVLGRTYRIPLHKALDQLASALGEKDGWHRLVLKTWTLHPDGRLYQACPGNRGVRVVDPLAGAWERAAASQLHLVHLQTVRAGAPFDCLTISNRPHRQVRLPAHLERESDAMRASGSPEARHRFLIVLADHVFSARRGLPFVEVQRTPARAALDIAAAAAGTGACLYAVEHAGRPGRPPITLNVLPVAACAEEVIVRACYGGIGACRRMSRAEWIASLSGFVREAGLPEQSRALARCFMDKLGLTVSGLSGWHPGGGGTAA